jgi:hypothetical protein
MKQSCFLCILYACLFSTVLNASTIYDLNITFGERFYVDPVDFSRQGEATLYGSITMMLSDDNQVIEYLDQSVKYLSGGIEYDDLYVNNQCPFEATLNCKTLAYREAEADYYYVYVGEVIETAISWRESVTFDGSTFTSNGIWNNGGDTPIYVNLIAAVTDSHYVPLPATVWLFGSGLIGLIGISRQRKNPNQ